MSDTTPVAVLELQVWASRALIAAGFPGGAVDQAARLVALARMIDEDAAAAFVADLPRIDARDHGTPDLGDGGLVDGRGLHALAVAPGVLDLACAGTAPRVYCVVSSPGAWVLPGVAMQGALRGRAVLAAAPGRAVLAWRGEGGPAFVEARGEDAVRLAAAAGVEAVVPEGGYLVAAVREVDAARIGALAGRLLEPARLAAHMAALRDTGFAIERETWDGITAWGCRMLVPSSDRSKAQAGGDMGEG